MNLLVLVGEALLFVHSLREEERYDRDGLPGP